MNPPDGLPACLGPASGGLAPGQSPTPLPALAGPPPMMLSDCFPMPLPRRLLEVRPGRILYGTDFPNLPHAWDREVKQWVALKPGDEAEAGILGRNALELLDVC